MINERVETKGPATADAVAALVVTLRDVPAGGLLTYAQIQTTHGIDPQDRRHGSRVCYLARERARSKHGLVFVVKPNEGYLRVKDAAIVESGVRHRRVRGQLRRREQEIRAVDIAALPEELKRKHANEGVRLALMKTLNKAPGEPVVLGGRRDGEREALVQAASRSSDKEPK